MDNIINILLSHGIDRCTIEKVNDCLSNFEFHLFWQIMQYQNSHMMLLHNLNVVIKCCFNINITNLKKITNNQVIATSPWNNNKQQTLFTVKSLTNTFYAQIEYFQICNTFCVLTTIRFWLGFYIFCFKWIFKSVRTLLIK